MEFYWLKCLFFFHHIYVLCKTFKIFILIIKRYNFYIGSDINEMLIILCNLDITGTKLLTKEKKWLNELNVE